MDLTRLRWRLRGAWQWPAFAAATVVEGVLLNALPVWGRGPGGVVAGLLLAMAFNLIVVAALAPLAGMVLRRRRPDLPKAIATDYCGTALIGALLALLVVGGIAHRDDVQAEEDGRAATVQAVSAYVHGQAPDYLQNLDQITVLRLETDFFRGCVPDAVRPDRRALCLFVNTDQSPAGVSRDPEQIPNYLYGR